MTDPEVARLRAPSRPPAGGQVPDSLRARALAAEVASPRSKVSTASYASVLSRAGRATTAAA